MRFTVHNPTANTSKGNRDINTKKQRMKEKQKEGTDGWGTKWKKDEQNKRTGTWREETKQQRIIFHTKKGGLLCSLSFFCLSLSTNSFLPLLFRLCLSVRLFHALWLSLVVFVCICQRVTCSVIRVSGTELSHIDRACTLLALSQTESWLDWASDWAQHGLTADPASPLKGQFATLHHIWNSQWAGDS